MKENKRSHQSEKAKRHNRKHRRNGGNVKAKNEK